MAEPLRTHRSAGPLLRAKLAVPPRRPGAVVRPRLCAQLSRAATRLTVLSAPAGWGKSTLLSEWAHDPGPDREVAWLSLDESDDEPVRFWTYALTALHGRGVGAAALAALGAPGVDPVDVAIPTLLNELASTTTDVTLVLDDYHVLSDPQVHESVEFFLTYLPGSARLVLAGRADPPLPLPRLRARGELTEIRVGDLRFTAPEATGLLARVADVELDDATVAELCERTEGWAAGLQLTALTLRSAATRPAAVAALLRGNRHVLDYFDAEVLPRLAPEHRLFLVQSSVLDRLSGSLCDAVLQRSGSDRVLADLDRANLFMVPLDQNREWYRCHALFRDALRGHLEADVARGLLNRASDWWHTRGALETAIGYAVEAGDHARAVALLRSAGQWVLDHGAGGIRRLGERLPTTVVRADPALCVFLAWTCALDGRYERMGTWLDLADDTATDDGAPPPGWHDLRAAAAAMRAVGRIAAADADAALPCAELAVAREDDPAVPGYVLARHLRGTALLVAGRFDEAVPVLDDAWHRSRELGAPPLLQLQPACGLALALYLLGRDEDAGRVCAETAPVRRLLEQAWGDAAAVGVARLQGIEGLLLLRDGDPDAALPLLREAVERSRVWGLASQVVMALTGLAEAELAVGDPAAAAAALAEASETAESEPVWPFVRRQLDAVETRTGRYSVRAARRRGVLLEDLTDRELSILRMLPGTANQREIGAALYLSINTVKGYAKSLYRKLDVGTRSAAVERARELGLL